MNQATNSNIIPGMRYKDAPAAVEWLCCTFGFSEHLVVPDGDCGIVHTHLVLGSGMIMLGSSREGGEFDSYVRLPREVGANTQSAYVVITDIDVHYRKAVEAGAEIVYEIADQEYGGRLYSALDPEGHLWNLGSYDPWAEAAE